MNAIFDGDGGEDSRYDRPTPAQGFTRFRHPEEVTLDPLVDIERSFDLARSLCSPQSESIIP